MADIIVIQQSDISKMPQIVIKYKDRTLTPSVQPSQPISSLKSQIQALARIPPIQQELSHLVDGKKTVLSDDKMPIQIAGISQNTELNLKNLGTQIRWNSVFYIQYGGPLLIFPLLFVIGRLLGNQYYYQHYFALAMALIHYTKRQLETAYVHVFSRQSMPLKRVFINSVHYWVFFALCNGVELYIIQSHPNHYEKPTYYILFALWAVFEFCNFKCHTILSSFRQKKHKSQGYVNESKQRGIPYGWGFNQISCANYFWEALCWITFSVLTRTYMAYMFTFYSIYQMLEWAIKKHKTYLKEFGDKYPRGRKAMFPFIL